MGNGKVFLKVFRPLLVHKLNGNTRSVRANQCSGRSVLFYLLKYDFLNVQSFYYDFDNPIHAGKLGHIVFKVTCLDALLKVWMIERCRFAFDGSR